MLICRAVQCLLSALHALAADQALGVQTGHNRRGSCSLVAVNPGDTDDTKKINKQQRKEAGGRKLVGKRFVIVFFKSRCFWVTK